MLQVRVIPCLLLRNQGLVKTIKFKNPTYVGDPINTLKLFNDKEVDEIIFLDILASRQNKKPQMEMIGKIASECFMPLCYGGGINTIDDIRTILSMGAEKVAINYSAMENSSLVKQAAEKFGSQSIVVAVDIKSDLMGNRKLYHHVLKKTIRRSLIEYVQKLEKLGAGELLINSVDRDGTMSGYDIDLIKSITSAVRIPVIACGGAGKLEHFKQVIKTGGASAVAAGSMFVFQGRHRAVLINYPSPEQIHELSENLGTNTEVSK